MGGVVDPADLLAGVGDDELTSRCLHSEEVLALDVAGVDYDAATAYEFVEDFSRLGAERIRSDRSAYAGSVKRWTPPYSTHRSGA